MDETSALLLTPSVVKDATTVLAWMEEYVSKPHSDLGREGAICPFVPSAVRNDTLRLAFHYEIDGSDVTAVCLLLLGYAEKFLRLEWANEAAQGLAALAVAFPRIPEERTTVLDDAHVQVKDEFVRAGLMIGQFHQRCPEPAAYNPAFRISIAPLPVVVIRYMAVHDILFLHGKDTWFAAYHARFGRLYERGQGLSPEYQARYRSAYAQFMRAADRSA